MAIERFNVEGVVDQIVFVLQHVHDLGEGEEDVKLVGVYSSASAAQAAVIRARTREGFKMAPDAFTIDEYVIDDDAWKEGYITIK